MVADIGFDLLAMVLPESRQIFMLEKRLESRPDLVCHQGDMG